MKVLSIHVTSVGIRQQDKTILRNTKKPSTKVLNIHVTRHVSISIEAWHKARPRELRVGHPLGGHLRGFEAERVQVDVGKDNAGIFGSVWKDLSSLSFEALKRPSKN